MSIKSSFLLLLIPLVCSVLAYTGFGFEFQVAVPTSCIAIIALLYWKRMKSFTDIFYIIAAFVFSIGGDWFLVNKGDSFIMFAAGIGLFFFAHLCYLIFAIINGKINRISLVLLLIIYLLFYIFALFPAIEEKVLSMFTLVYLLISCISVAAAVGTNLYKPARWAYLIGILFILISDTIIAFKEFLAYPELNFLILPTYYAAHICITFALIVRITNEQENGAPLRA
ncbi:lysoplasmalogenase [Maribellus sp. CM-23]|uniref:lysoplasmalogenase n=1 Tax=Maribellus sp. CM-23 TaxID=2781026 RepID=UPI0021D41362|nr:lysoplasmalogenase [Maribellus sp. CM-23]MCE4565899.1 lysoplasmalogenase [Maribellus sp. CM-23]